MNRFAVYIRSYGRLIGFIVISAVILSWLLLYKLDHITGGLSASELAAARNPVGWHFIYQHPMGLPLNIIRSVVQATGFGNSPGAVRLPNVILGALSISIFAWLIRFWHGPKPAVLATLLFATSAWVLHASRLASPDVLYLWAVLVLLMMNIGLHDYDNRPFIWYGNLMLWGLMLYIPGMVWLVLLSIVLQRKHILSGWKQFILWWQRLLYALAGLVWLPLLIIDLLRPGQVSLWLGLPPHLATPATLLKQLVAVPVHLFLRGPQYPDVWLGRLPILDAFSLTACLVGIYFYGTHRQSVRGRLIGLFFAIGTLLIALGGPVSLSLLVPLLYLLAGTGIAYLLHIWLRVFPINPFARSLGIGIIALAVSLSCIYNLREYFIAWPHNSVTRSTFHYRS